MRASARAGSKLLFLEPLKRGLDHTRILGEDLSAVVRNT